MKDVRPYAPAVQPMNPNLFLAGVSLIGGLIVGALLMYFRTDPYGNNSRGPVILITRQPGHPAISSYGNLHDAATACALWAGDTKADCEVLDYSSGKPTPQVHTYQASMR